MWGFTDDPVDLIDVANFPGSHVRGDIYHGHLHLGLREGGAGCNVQLPEFPYQRNAVSCCSVVQSEVHDH